MKLKCLILLLLIISLEARASFGRYKKSVRKTIKRGGDQESKELETEKKRKNYFLATFEGTVNFFIGSLHGISGFDDTEDIGEKCNSLDKDLPELAYELGITEKKEIIKKFPKIKTLNKDTLKKYFSDKESLKKPLEVEESTEKLPDEFDESDDESKPKKGKTFRSLLKNLYEKVSFFTDIFGAESMKSAKEAAKIVYCEFCRLRKIIVLVVKMILNPASIPYYLDDFLQEVTKEYEVIQLAKGIAKKTAKDIKCSIDMMKKSKWKVERILGETLCFFKNVFETTIDQMDDLISGIKAFISKAFEKIKALIELGIESIKEIVKKIYEFVKDLFTNFFMKLWGKIDKQKKSVIESIFSAASTFLENTKENFKKFLQEKKERIILLVKRVKRIVMAAIKVLKCSFSIISLILKGLVNIFCIISNILSIISVFSLNAALPGSTVPVVIVMFIDMIIGIACNWKAFEKMFLLAKYISMEKSPYAIGALIGLLINTLGNSDFLILPIAGSLTSWLTDGIPTLVGHFTQFTITEVDTDVSKALKVLDPFGFTPQINKIIAALTDVEEKEKLKPGKAVADEDKKEDEKKTYECS